MTNTTSNDDDYDHDFRVGDVGSSSIGEEQARDNATNNNSNANANANTNTMGSVTPKPSAVFSATSSFSALSNFNDNNDNEYNNDDYNDQDYNNNYDDNCEDNNNDAFDIYIDCSCDKDYASSSSPPPIHSTTNSTKSKPSQRPMHQSCHSCSNSNSWKLRMVELFIVHIVLFASMTVCFQAANRLTLLTVKVPGGGDGGGGSSGASSSGTLLVAAEATNNNSTVPEAALATTTMPPDPTTATTTELNQDRDEDDCIYVPGGGFSGFWFSLGRLQSLQHPQDERFVCYSAGCLGVVSVLWNHFHENSINGNDNNGIDNGNTTTTTTNHNNNHNDNENDKKNQYERLYENARSAQVEWQTGRMHRYRVVETFIDGLLDPLLETDDSSTLQSFLEIVQKTMYVVTTVFGDDDVDDDDESNNNANAKSSLPLSSMIPRAKLQQPTDVASLKRLLLQTTWIPLATGSSLTHKGHMDGAFSMVQHPRCRKTVGLALSAFAGGTETSSTGTASAFVAPPSLYEFFEKSAILWTNTLNVNLNRQDVERLWSIGLEYGV